MYETILKRKSVRSFDQSLSLTENELTQINQQLSKLIPLIDGIKVTFRLVERTKTSAKLGEYCLLLYSEKKTHYLLNAGYLLEQMDLFLASKNIGACWYGLAKTKEKEVEGMDYVIMLAFGKSQPEEFRTTTSQFKRKDIDLLWSGEFDADVKAAVRLAPSACNTQPWRLRNESNQLRIYRSTTLLSFIPTTKLPYYNSIDMGICLCILEVALLHKGYKFQRTLIEPGNVSDDLVEIATYQINE